MSEYRPVREGREKAESVRYQHDLGDAPVRDLFGFIEKNFKDLLVVRFPMEAGPDGALLKANKRWIIVVNTWDQLLVRQRYTASHELGHYLFDREHSAIQIDRQILRGHSAVEVRANAFAVHFLLPATVLRTRFQSSEIKVDDPQSIVATAMEYGLSVQSLSWHMLNVLGISETDRQRIVDIRNPFRIAARMGLSYRVGQEMNAKNAKGWPRQYLALASRAFEANHIDEEEFASLIGDEELFKSLRDAITADGAA